MTNDRVESSSGRAARKLKLALMGPAFIAAIGYIDPGNFATNIQAGASFGYKLLWVVVWANLMAMLIQVLSAKLGIATGKNLAEQIRDHYPRPVVWFYWVQAEIIAMATDLAEFIGAAIGFKLILGVSLLQGAVLTGIATFLILMLQRRGQKPLEKVIGGLLLFVAAAYIVELIFSQPNFAQLSKGMVIPSLPNSEAVFLAAGVILFSLFVGVVMLPILLQHIEVADHSQQLKEERIARAATAEVAIVAIQKMEERLAADTEENIDNQLLTEVSSRVIGNLRRRADGRNDVESSVQEENLERRFRLAALRSERAELYHLRATREISNETLQKLLHDLDLLEALLIEENQ